MYSPDGTRLAFVSNRTGNGDLYVLNLSTGALQRITFDDAAEQLDGWSRDGKFLYFSSSSQEVASMNDIFRISAEGGMPVAVSADRYVNEFFSAPSPDGKSLAFTARGNTSSQWWRHGHSHLDESEIWLATFASAPKYEKLAGGDFKCLWPMWSGDGTRVYFMSDQGGAENLWEKSVKGGAPRQVTQFHDGRVLWPSISYDGKTIVFERDFGIWKLDTATGKAAPIEITRRGAAGTPEVNHLSLTNQFRDLVLAPDGRKLAFTAHGEVFAAAAREGGHGSPRHAHHGQRESDRLVAGQPPHGVCLGSRRHLSSVPSRFRQQHRDSPHQRRGRRNRSRVERRTENCSGSCATASSCASTMWRRNRCASWPSGRFPRPPFGSNRFYAWSPDNQWIAYCHDRRSEFRERLRRAGRGRNAAPDQFPRQHQRRHGALGARWHLPSVRHQPADREQQYRAHRPGAEDAALPRGPFPRSLPRHAGRTAAGAGCGAPRCASGRGRTYAGQTGGDRLRRTSAAA